MRTTGPDGAPRNRVEHSFLPLLISLAGVAVFSPITTKHPLAMTFLVSTMLVSGLWGFLRDPRYRLPIAAAVVLTLTLHLAAEFRGADFPWLLVAAHLSLMAFFGVLAVLVLATMLGDRIVTPNTIMGAICGYLLIAFVFGFAYAVLLDFDESAIGFPGMNLADRAVAPLRIPELIYFSFTTLTTLGFGDILPNNPTARSLAILEVLCGQLYLAVLIARLVGAVERSNAGSGENKGVQPDNSP